MAENAQGYVTVQQLWQTPYIRGVYSEIATPDLSLTKMYGIMSNREFTPSRVFGFDQFNKTRTVATMKEPMTAPSVIRRQRIASKTGALLRVAEKLHIYDEEIAHLRPPGTPIGTLDQRGEAWFTQQVEFMTQRHRNLIELAVSKAIQGGFGMAKSGEMYYLTELNASGNAFNIDMFQVENDPGCRARHTGDLDGIIDTPWSDPGANIVHQLMKLRQRQIIEYGADCPVAITDSLTISYMMNNVSLSQIAGSSRPVWQSWNQNGPTEVSPGDRNLGGQVIVFNAIPQYKWLVNDAVVSLGNASDPQGSDSFVSSGVSRVIPAGHVIFTPNPGGDWIACYEGEEPVRKSWQSDSQMARGFEAWNFPLPQHPPGREANMIDNFLPVVRMPRAIWNATVRPLEAFDVQT